MITVPQIKAARAMLDMRQSDLSAQAKISIGTLNNIERGVQTDPKISTMRAIQSALETAGIEFIERNGEGVGIALKAKPVKRSDHPILIIDDTASDRKLYKNWLAKQQSQNLDIIEADNAQDGYDAYVKTLPS